MPFLDLSALGLSTSPQQLYDEWLAYMQTAFPGYIPRPGNLDNIQALAISTLGADVTQTGVIVPDAIWRAFGTKLVGVPYRNGLPATASVQVTAVDTAGYTLTAGQSLTLGAFAFNTLSDLVIPNGSSTGTVTVVANDSGIAYNGATNPTEFGSIVNWVSGVTTLAPASGGVDPEEDADYQNRLASALQLQAPRPITAADYATMALSFSPAAGTDQELVGRATSVDGYNPADGSIGNERMVAVAITDANGDALNSDTKTAVAAWLQSLSEINMIVNVIDPTYTTVYVKSSIHLFPGFDPASTRTAVQAAVMDYLSPQNFGLPPFGDLSSWLNSTTIHYSRVMGVIQNVSGVDYVAPGSLKLGIAPSPTGTTDLSLTGPVSLPTSTNVSISLPTVV